VEDDNVEGIKKSILAGDDAFDLAQGHDISMAQLSMQNAFYNLYDVPHLNFDKPWWPEATTESMTVAGQMYMMFNNISYNNLASTRVMYFNKSLMNELDLEYPYQMVYDGTWTMDVMQNMSASAYKDINGDGKQDNDDRYGYISMPYFYAVVEPFCV
jgi:ABC-type glycerol-3-phosphate transport system substrate-binding protein